MRCLILVTKVKFIALSRGDLEKLKDDYFKRFNPCGYDTRVDCEGFVEKDSFGNVPVIYDVKLGKSCFFTDSVDFARREVRSSRLFNPDASFEEVVSPYFFADISRLDSCD